MNKLILIAALALLATVLGVGSFLGLRARGSAVPTPAAGESTDSSTVGVTASVEPAANASRVARRLLPAAPAPSVSSVNPAVAFPENRPTTAEIAFALSQRVDSERPDPAWTSRAQSALTTDLYAAGLQHTSVTEVKCGASSCRATLKHDQPIDRHQMVLTLANREPFAPGAFYHHDERTNGTTIFVARPGTELFDPHGGVALATAP